jgi:3-deoxy-manno-octulosonate cytidylyltransferase (CMP-KDO synthetase)
MTTRGMIDQALEPVIMDGSIEVLNLMADISREAEFQDKNCIKVVCDQMGNALFFSREPIPSRWKEGHNLAKKQVCVITFTRKALLTFNEMKQTPLEMIESIDMLRFVEGGIKVRMQKTENESYSVDTKDDLKRVESILSKK